MKRLALVMVVMIVALGLSRLGVHMLATAPPLPPPNFIVSDSPKPLPAIVFADGEGKAGSLADFRGKFVLLNIWATWCIPCRKEMPTLDRLQARLGGPDFEVVTLSIDRGGADAVRKFYAQIGIRNLAITLDAKGEAPFKLGTVGVPTTLLINREGQEIGRLIGAAEWDSPTMVEFLKATIAKARSESSPPPAQEKSQ
jgi:thiol-disulfide isomerase/thioredoxin